MDKSIDTQGATSAAIAAWIQALGNDRVLSDDATLARYARTTQAQAPRPSCILYPQSTAEVQQIVRIAGEHGVVVYPISCGKNWGYGDACAATPGAAIVDLGRMNRIHEVNTDLAYCVIEPGVTQGQLYAHLQEHKTGLWMDATAAGPDSSLVGNTLDRGFGHTRYGDHFETCCGMEIVLADGRILNTGFGHFENARANRVYRYGVGPFMDGIFCQSNLGIITKIGVWLLPEPEAFNFFYFQVPNFEDLGTLVDRLRPLRIAGVLQSAIHIGNDLRVIAGSGRYPWDAAKGLAPLPLDVRAQVRGSKGLQAWNGAGSLTGCKGHVRASRKALKKALKGLANVVFWDDRKVALANTVVNALNRVGLAKVIRNKLDAMRPNYELLKGVPCSEPLNGAQWRLRNPSDGPPREPLDVGVGLYWISPVMPLMGTEVMPLLRMAEPIFLAHGFDMIVSFILLTERCLVGIFNIAFDQAVPGEADRASECYEALLAAMMKEGYVIYRSGLQGMPKLREHESVYWDVARQIKQALDPKDIIARGRYIAPLDGGL